MCSTASLPHQVASTTREVTCCVSFRSGKNSLHEGICPCHADRGDAPRCLQLLQADGCVRWRHLSPHVASFRQQSFPADVRNVFA